MRHGCSNGHYYVNEDDGPVNIGLKNEVSIGMLQLYDAGNTSSVNLKIFTKRCDLVFAL